MRHVLGLLVGIVLAPAALYGAAWSEHEASKQMAKAQHGATLDNKLLPAFGVLLAVGLVLGIVAAARWLSPVAALVMGVVFVGVSVAFAVKPHKVNDLIVKRIHGDIGTSVVGLLSAGVVVLVGGLLLASAVMPNRWRTAPAEEDLGLGWEPPSARQSAFTPSSSSPGSSDYDTSDYSSSGGLSGGSAFGGGSSGSAFGSSSPASESYGSSPTTPGYNSPSYGRENYGPSPSTGYGPSSPSANPWNDR